MRPIPFCFFFGLFITGGCDENKLTNTGTGTIADTQSACEAGCSWDADCNLADFDTCVEACIEDAAGWQRQDALQLENTCVSRLSCDDDPDDCGAYVEPLAEHLAFEAKCLATLSSCGLEDELDCSTSFDPDDPDAGLVRYMTPELVAELSACLDLADCDAAIECIDDTLDPFDLEL
jgi:hypothetical protein